MNNPEAIKVIEEFKKWYPEKTIDMQEVYNALSHCLTILEKLEKAKGVLPEEKELFQPLHPNHTERYVEIKNHNAEIWNACRQQVKLNLIKVEERLPEIINKIIQSHSAERYKGVNMLGHKDIRWHIQSEDYENFEIDLRKAISDELRGK